MNPDDMEPPEGAAQDVHTPWKHTRRELAMRWLGAALATLLVIVVALGVVVRYGALTDAGRRLIAAPLQGLSLGPLGKLHIEGLTGDVLGDFHLRRLTIVDDQGVWLDAHDIEVRWRSVELLHRRVHVESLSAASVQVLRRPAVKASVNAASSSSLPVSILVDRLQTRLETLPAFSVQRGLFEIGASLDVERVGGLGGAIQAQSLLHAGDGLNARFDLGLHHRLMVQAQALETRGGALAGSLGLPATQSFQLDADADGAVGDGRLKLNAMSNGRSFAQAWGNWRNGGGAVDAWFSLAASTLTSRLVHALGPQLRLAVQSQPAAAGLQAIRGQLFDDNGAASLAGLLDPKKIAAPNGFELDLNIRDLKRVTETPAMGALRAAGRFSIVPKGWAWSGKAAVDHLSAYNYALAGAGGPIEIDDVSGEIRLTADIQGTGGQGATGRGQSILAIAAGARPHATLDVSRLADGRLLLRSVKLAGAAFDLDATGERDVFGGLSFKGDAKITNLAGLRPGVRGGVQANWSATQPRANDPWAFTFDARGDRLASGYAELDRLLGPAPRLTAAARYDHGAVALSKADLTGAAASAGLAGNVGKDGAIKMALNWSAQGPFEAGPVEIAGKAAGAGSLGGTLSAPNAELTADFDRIDLPGLAFRPAHLVLSLSGAPNAADQVALTAGSDYGPAHAKAVFRLLGDGLALDDLDLAAGGLTASGSLVLHGQEPSSANLAVSAVAGAFLSRGRIDARLGLVDNGGGPSANLSLTAKDATPRGATIVISDARLTATGPLAKLPYSLTADGVSAGAPFRLNGGGETIEQGSERSVSFAGAGRIREADFKTLSPVLINLDGPAASLRAALSYGGGTANIDLKQSAGALSGKAALDGVDLTALGQDVVGRVTGDLSIDGQGPRLDGEMNARLDGLRSRDALAKLALNGAVQARLSGSKLNIDASVQGAQAGDKASIDLVLPVQASAAPFNFALVRDQPIDGRFDANAELQPIWDLFFGGDRTLGGHLVAQGRIGGDIASPRPVGHAALTGGRFEDAATGLKLRNLDADVDLRDEVLSVSKFTAADAKAGTLVGQGRFSLEPAGASNLTLTAKDFQLLDSDAAKATASGTLSVTRGGDGKAQLTGQLTIDRADISAVSARAPPGVTSLAVTEINGPDGAAEAPAAPKAGGPAVGLDVRLRAPRGIFVKGLGLNAEMSLDAQVGGTTAAPALSGVAHVVRGDYDLAGKRFEIDDQGVVYLASELDKIRLDLIAKLDDSSLTAQINIGGTAAKPEITLSSVPALPSDEVLSQVLFGSSAAQLSPVQAAQLAAAVTALATGGGFDVMGGLKNFARLDRLALGGGDPSTGLTVSGGKYIGNNVYLEVTGGGRQGPSAQVEVRANRSLSLISEVGGDVGAKLSVRWRLDYGKAKPAKSAKTAAQ